MRYLSAKFSGLTYLYLIIISFLIQALFVLQIFGIIPSLNVSYDIFKITGTVLVFLTIYIYLLRRGYRVSKILRINTFPAKYLFYTIGVSVCMYLFAASFNPLARGVFYQEWDFAFFSTGDTPVWISAAYWLISGIVTGIVFSAIIQQGLHIRRPFMSCLVTGLLYALFIICDSILFSVFSVPALISFTVCGFAFCYLSVKSNSIIPAMISLVIFNLLNGFGFMDWYSGILYQFGFDYAASMAVLTILSVLAGGFVLCKMPKSNKKSESSDKPVIMPETEVYTAGSDKQRKSGFIIGAAVESGTIIASIVFTFIMAGRIAN